MTQQSIVLSFTTTKQTNVTQYNQWAKLMAYQNHYARLLPLFLKKKKKKTGSN